ncbi:MAG: SDR family NAD(P)-dependent oxidoreductase [Sphingomonadales bacterium]
MIDLGFANRVVVVTGGASNIGRGIVHAFARQGADLVIVDIDDAKAEATRQEAVGLGAAACACVHADLSDAGACAGFVADIEKARGRIDVLVNNMGWGDPGLLLQTRPEQWDRLWRLNLGATIACSHAVLAGMKERRGGALVALASDAAQGVPNQSVYGALKSGVIAFTKAVAREFGRYGIRANAVSPGIVVPGPEEAGQGSVWNRGDTVLSERQIAATLDLSALRRPTTADDIAMAVLFLASDTAARQITGQHISVGGGWWMP